MLHDQTRERSSDHPRHRDGKNEKRHHSPAQPVWKPECKIEDNAGKESGFGGAKQDAREIELLRTRDERHRHGNEAPQAHDAGDRLARADFLQQQIARHLEQDVADVKQADAQPIARIGQVEIVLKLQFGKTDIDAINVVQHVADEDEGDDPQDHLAVKPAFAIICRNRKTLSHAEFDRSEQ